MYKLLVFDTNLCTIFRPFYNTILSIVFCWYSIKCFGNVSAFKLPTTLISQRYYGDDKDID